MQILDCTLRDGGYYTNWDFSPEMVETYFQSFNQLPVDYLEIGYRSNPMKEYLGQYFYCPDYVLQNAREKSNKKLVIIFDEKDVRAEHVPHLLAPCKGLIDMVRIALDPQQLGRALKLAEAIKKLGFEVGFNIMYMSKWKQYGDFLDEIKQVDGLADYFYMVDSYGGVYPKDVIETIGLVKERSSCKLGFHGHNNMELGLINSLTALEHGADIIDATVTGMGRGAGNLKTELLLTALNSRDGLEVDFNALSNVTDAFEKLQKQHEWGTNLPYMVSGANSLPQKDVMNWVTQRFYSFNSIIRALQNQKKGVKDNEQLPVFAPSKKYQTAIVVGGGPNAVQHHQAVQAYLAQNPDACLIHASSKNAASYKKVAADQYFCLVGNEGYRLEKAFADLGGFEGQCILPPFPRKMGTYVPAAVRQNTYELGAVQFTQKLTDTHTALALQAALELGVQQVLMVGYDGYQGAAMSQQERTLISENEYLFRQFQQEHPAVQLLAVTPTNYDGIPQASVYQFLG